jgi:hypothetical protein
LRAAGHSQQIDEVNRSLRVGNALNAILEEDVSEFVAFKAFKLVGIHLLGLPKQKDGKCHEADDK